MVLDGSYGRADFRPAARFEAGRTVALVCVAGVFLGPFFLSRPDERWRNLVAPVFFLAEVPWVLVAAIPVVLLTDIVLFAWYSRWPPRRAWLIPLAVAAVGVLPGMVSVHRRFLAPYSFADNILPSLFCLSGIIALSLGRAAFQPERLSVIVEQGLIAASLTNAVFPWIAAA